MRIPYRFDQYKLLTMPSSCTSNDIDLVQPTQCIVQPNRVLKRPPPESWLLPDFEPPYQLYIPKHADFNALI